MKDPMVRTGISGVLVLAALMTAVFTGHSEDKKRTATARTPLAKPERSRDFAVGLIDAGKLQHGLSNDGALGTLWGWNSEIYLAFPGGWFKGYGYIADLSMMIGVPEGPWTPKLRNPAGGDSLSMGPSVSERFGSVDWGPRMQSYGRLHSGAVDARQISSRGSPPAYPVMATSTIPDTWPEGYHDASGQWISTPGTRHWPGPWARDPGPDGIARTEDDTAIVGQFTGDKELFFSMNDYDLNDQGVPYAAAGGADQGHPLNVQFDIHAIGYGRSFAEDFIFFPMKIVYNGADTLKGVYLGFYIDVDAPEFNASGAINHREDWMAFIRSEYEPSLDSTVNYNMAFIYDQQSGGIGPYAGTGPVAYTAIKLLETPLATEDIDLDGNGAIDIRAGTQLGITDWHWFRWENRPGVIKSQYREWEQYKLMSGGSKTTLWDASKGTWGDFKVSQGSLQMADTLSDGRVIKLESVHLTPDAWFHRNASGQLNPHFDDFDIIGKTVVDLDAVFIMSCGPFTLIPTDTTTFSFALIMGESLADLKLNARTAQTMYDLNYLGAEAPTRPTVTAVPGNQRVTLYWDSEAEESVDILSGYKDFEGYKIYRSIVHPSNNVWGDPIIDAMGTVVGFIPLAQYDLENSIAGLDPVYPHLDRGGNTGLVHMFVDSTVENGVTYWYSVCAYDRGISDQNDPSLNPDNWADLNYLENAKGNNVGQTPNLVEVIPGGPPLGYVPPSAGTVFPDPDSLGKGTIEPLLINPSLASSPHTYTVTFDDTTMPGTLLYSVRDETQTLLVDRSPETGGSDAGPVFNGIRMVLDNPSSVAHRDGRWVNVSDDTSNIIIGDMVRVGYANPSDYLLAFHDGGQPGSVGARVYNITADPARSTALVDTVLRMPSDSITYYFTLKETVGGQAGVATWRFPLSIVIRYSPLDTVIVGSDTTIHSLASPPVMPLPGDEYLLRTLKPPTMSDVFTFTVQGSTQKASLTSQEMNAIKVVPNPYLATADWELSPTQKRIAFTNLPPTCTIEIFTVTGELVRRIERLDAAEGFEYWNLLNSSNRMAAYGLYVYVVTAPGGAETVGKFVLIR